MSPYQTHQPLLFACARHARGPVIELGCGMHSTPQLAALCGDFRSYETDTEWAALIRRFRVPVIDVRSYDDVPVRRYGLVFIDNAPAERRKVDLARFAESELVVVHDSEYPLYDLKESLALYPYRFDYVVAKPNTTVVSRDREAIRRIAAVFE